MQEENIVVMTCSKCGKQYEWPNKQFARYLRVHAGCDLDKYLCKECVTSERSRTHAESKSPIYARWKDMFARTKRAGSAKYYLNKGIKVCAEWYDYKAFKAWALENGYDPRLELDRVDGNKGYSPENCRWVIKADNNRNRTMYGKEELDRRSDKVSREPA